MLSLTVVCSSSASESLSSSAQREGCKWGLPGAQQFPTRSRTTSPFSKTSAPPDITIPQKQGPSRMQTHRNMSPVLGVTPTDEEL